MKTLISLLFILLFSFVGQAAIANQTSSVSIVCHADLYRVHPIQNLVKERTTVKATFEMKDPANSNIGNAKLTILFNNDYKVTVNAQLSLGASKWEDGSNTVTVHSYFSRLEANNDETVLAFQKGSTDELDAKWKVAAHAKKNDMAPLHLNLKNTEIDTATLKASKELGEQVDGKYTVLIEKGYLPEKLAHSAYLYCLIPQ